jgi:hypothetical protein
MVNMKINLIYWLGWGQGEPGSFIDKGEKHLMPGISKEPLISLRGVMH